MSDCLFCRIAAGEIPSNKVYEDDLALAFHDIDPQAPNHVLVIPKKHIANVMGFQEDDAELIQHVFEVITIVAQKLGMDKSGFRVVANTGKDGMQSVEHVHFHVLGGRMMTWPPG